MLGRSGQLTRHCACLQVAVVVQVRVEVEEKLWDQKRIAIKIPKRQLRLGGWRISHQRIVSLTAGIISYAHGQRHASERVYLLCSLGSHYYLSLSTSEICHLPITTSMSPRDLLSIIPVWAFDVLISRDADVVKFSIAVLGAPEENIQCRFRTHIHCQISSVSRHIRFQILHMKWGRVNHVCRS